MSSASTTSASSRCAAACGGYGAGSKCVSSGGAIAARTAGSLDALCALARAAHASEQPNPTRTAAHFPTAIQNPHPDQAGPSRAGGPYNTASVLGSVCRATLAPAGIEPEIVVAANNLLSRSADGARCHP